MKRLIIVCEGETEQQFCEELLRNHLFNKSILMFTPIIKKTNGGICTWSVLKKQLKCHLNEGQAFVTTFIDYYGIKDSYAFPRWIEAKTIEDKYQRMIFLENSMLEDMDTSLRTRFIPYLQLHEFESLLFCNLHAFEDVVPAEDIKDRSALEKVLYDYPNPELINENVSTSPSHRLQHIINGYVKTIYGAELAKSIGLYEIRERCPHFNEWLTTIEAL